MDPTHFHKYQRAAMNFVVKHPRAGLFLDMGLGKTIITLSATAYLLDNFNVLRVLIVAPLRVANNVWKQEAAKWTNTQHLRIGIATGTAENRTRVLKDTRNDIVIINRENLVWLIKQKLWKFDMLIIDESSSFKNSDTARFKALRKVLPHIKRMLLLTGTPSPNGLKDLWSQVYLLDRGRRLGYTKGSFMRNYFRPAYEGGYEVLPGAVKRVKERIKDLCIYMSSEDYLDLPKVIVKDELIDFDNELRKTYDKFKKTLVLAAAEADKNIEALSAAQLINKLLQFCNGQVYDEEAVYHSFHDLKCRALSDIAEDNPGENLLVAYSYRADLDRLKGHFPHAEVLTKNPNAIERWNKGEIPMLLAHPASAGHGLNLQSGGSIVVWYGLNWSLELYDQMNARLNRQGQQRPVRIIRLLIKNTVDQLVAESLASKGRAQSQFLNYLHYELNHLTGSGGQSYTDFKKKIKVI